MVEPDNSSFYDDAAPLEPHLIYQGEILIGVPVLTSPKPLRWLLLRGGKDESIDQILGKGQTPKIVKVYDSNITDVEWDKLGENGDYAAGRLSKRPVLVLNQTCDVSNNDFIQVAPIYPTTDDNYIGKLLRNEIIDAFYLRQHPPDWEKVMYADLEQIQAIHKSYRKPHKKEEVKEYRHFRLSPSNILKLQQNITRYFGRPNAFDAGHDKVPRTATYLCVNCFHRYGRITSIDLAENDDFKPCRVCSAPSWTIQLGSIK